MRKLILSTALSLSILNASYAEEWRPVEQDGGYSNAKVTIARQSAPQPASRVVDTAKHFLGIPYVWAGASPSQGFDCSGYVYEVFRLNGYFIPRMADIQFEASERVVRKNLKPGDMVFFTTYLEGPSHVGIYLGEGEFIHASSAGEGVVVSNLDQGYYQERFLGGGRPPGWIASSAKNSKLAAEMINEQELKEDTALAIAKIAGVEKDLVDLEKPLKQLEIQEEEPLADDQGVDPFDKRRLRRSKTVPRAPVAPAHLEVSSRREAAVLGATQTVGEMASLALSPMRRMATRMVRKMNGVVNEWTLR